MDSSSGYQFPTMICTTCIFAWHEPALLHGQTLVHHGRVSSPQLTNYQSLTKRTSVSSEVVCHCNRSYHRQLQATLIIPVSPLDSHCYHHNSHNPSEADSNLQHYSSSDIKILHPS
jgi:hypothetical protein